MLKHTKVEKIVDETAQELELSLHHLAILRTLVNLRLIKYVRAQHADDPLQEEDDGQDGRAHLMADYRGKVLRLLLRMNLF